MKRRCIWGIPFVLIDSYVNDPDVCSVGLEDEKGGYIATKHLLENGHRTIAFASPTVQPGGVLDLRLQGYRRALAEYGIPFDPPLVFMQEISVQEGKRLGHQLSQRPEITGIFASADILAAGIMSGLDECGLSVPRDKSIVGFDDHYLCLGYDSCTASKRAHRGKKVILPVRLVERNSVRRIKP